MKHGKVCVVSWSPALAHITHITCHFYKTSVVKISMVNVLNLKPFDFRVIMFV